MATGDPVVWPLWQQARHGPGNILISPAAVSEVLGMLALGARGKTAKELSTVPSLATQVAQDKVLSASLAAQGESIQFTNGIFAQSGLALVDAFRTSVQQLQGDIQALDMKGHPQESEDAINAWVAKNTHDQIPQVLSDLPSQSDLVLVNALYFKGQWAEPFPKTHTVPETFTLSDGQESSVSMMHGDVPALYGEDGQVQLLDLL
jgi:serpin B